MDNIIFAHNDLDGLICAAIALKCLEGKTKTIFSSNLSLNKFFFVTLSKLNNFKNIFFFDFSVREILVKVSSAIFKKVAWIDHHVNEKLLEFQNVEYLIDENCESAAKLVSKYFNFYTDWIDIVNEIDVNKCESEISKNIRDYFSYLRIKYGKLYNRILSLKARNILNYNPKGFVDKEEVKNSLEEFKKMKENFEKIIEENFEIKEIKNLKVAVIEIKENIPPYIIFEKIKNIEIFDLMLIIYRGLKGVKLEFRSLSDVDVQKIAKQFNGGGHKKASGAYLKDSLTKSQILSKIEELL